MSNIPPTTTRMWTPLILPSSPSTVLLPLLEVYAHKVNKHTICFQSCLESEKGIYGLGLNTSHLCFVRHDGLWGKLSPTNINKLVSLSGNSPMLFSITSLQSNESFGVECISCIHFSAWKAETRCWNNMIYTCVNPEKGTSLQVYMTSTTALRPLPSPTDMAETVRKET